MNILEGKIAVISGGSRGLGFGIAKAFLREGALVIIASRSIESVETAVENLHAEGGKVAGMQCDVGILEQVESLSQFVKDKFGRFDVWVNNAGVSCPTGPTVHIPPEMVQSLVRTNILGVYNGSIIAMRHFLEQDSGKLINMVGKGERRPVPLHNAYSSSRAWVRNFTLAMAKEYKSTGVGIFLLNPGLVATDMLQNLHFIEGYEHNIKVLQIVQRLFANPPDIPASNAVWLASSATDGKTGIYRSSIGPGGMITGLGKEALRKVSRQETAVYDPNITLVEPAIDLELADNTAIRQKRERSVSYLVRLNGKEKPSRIGKKAENLNRLIEKHFLVPVTFVLDWGAYKDFLKIGDSVLKKLRSEFQEKLNSNSFYAVRSSAEIEDQPDHSFAGQFKTLLNIQGLHELISAVKAVWASENSDLVRDYLENIQKDNADLHMAVIIQEMIRPVISGVSFSINPITSLDEVVIEAVQGSGEQLVQEGITPMRWVSKWGNLIEKPNKEIVPLDVIQEVAETTQKVSKAFGRNVDLEWIYDGDNVYWLQMRDITAISKANVYSNKIAKEMTPGLVKPLDWSVIVPIKSEMWIDVISQVIGDNEINPNNLAKLFNYRVYHNLGTFGGIFESLGLPRESLDIMMGVAPPGAGKPPFKPTTKMIQLSPRIIRFLWDKWNYGLKAEREYPLLEAEANTYSLHPSKDLSPMQLIELIDQMKDLNLRVTSNTFHCILLMQIYSKIFGSQLKYLGIDFAQFDLGDGLVELDDYNPNAKLGALNQIYLELDDTLQTEIAGNNYHVFRELDGIDHFRKEFDNFIDQFGHMSDRTGVFDTVPWRETPEVILDLIIHYKKPDGIQSQKISFGQINCKGLRGWIIKVFYNRARLFYLLREKFSSLYSYTLMLFRVYYLVIADDLLENGLLDIRDDIYFLYDEEIRSYILGDNGGQEFKQLVKQRKNDLEICKEAITPEIIFGDTPPPVVVQPKLKLTGTPTSRGYYTGKAKIVCGLGDFHKLVEGDVLVIPHSDVGWVPLFSKAGAVVAESGGMLSHSSIVAREYGVPAVVSVNGALQLQDEMVISVDGYKGEVFVHGTV
jgi:pyruvate,water dikinase